MTAMTMNNPRMYSITVWDNDIHPVLTREYDLDALIPENLSEDNFDRAVTAMNYGICEKDHVGNMSYADGIISCIKGVGEKDEDGDYWDFAHGEKYCFIVDDNYGFTHALDRFNRVIGVYAVKGCDSDYMKILQTIRGALEEKIYASSASIEVDEETDAGLKFYAYFDNFACRPVRGFPRGLVRIKPLDYLFKGVKTEEDMIAALKKGNRMIANYYSKRGMDMSVSAPDGYLGGRVEHNDEIVCYGIAARTLKSEIERLEDLIVKNSNGITSEQFFHNFSGDYDIPDSDFGIDDKDKFWTLTTISRIAKYLGYARS